MESILFLLIGIVIGAVVIYLFIYIRNTSAAINYKYIEKENVKLKSEIAEHNQDIVQLTKTNNQLTRDYAICEMRAVTAEDALKKERTEHEQQLLRMREEYALQKKEMRERFDETMARVMAEMKNATDEMLKDRQREFSESSHLQLGMIVNPLRETIDKMKQAMHDTTIKQTAMSSEMKANIENMMRQSESAQRSAEELTRVFKHGSKVQGDWGETVLDELLQAQGLTQGVHYDTQSVIRDASGNVVKSANGSVMRPDVILHLDKSRELIIDSKVSLTAYIDYVNAESEAERQQCLKLHIDSLQKHVKELSAKDYSSYIKSPKVCMDYVIMFVPHAGALWTALGSQPDLWRRAMERGVFIADEQTLFAALKIIDLTWTQIIQAQNHERVFELANEMIDRVGQFVKKYNEVGKAIEKAHDAYTDGARKLAPQGQSIITTANKLVKLGAKHHELIAPDISSDYS